MMRLRVLLIFLALCGCTAAPVPMPPWPGPPVVPAPPPGLPPPPPVLPPPGPVDPPPDAPATVQAALARIVVGATLAEATAALGLGPAQQVPGTIPTARWFLTEGEQKWMVYVLLDASGRVSGKGMARVEVIR